MHKNDNYENAYNEKTCDEYYKLGNKVYINFKKISCRRQ